MAVRPTRRFRRMGRRAASVTGQLQLGRLALAREGVDRATEHRSDPAWLAAAWADPGTHCW